MRRRVDVPLVQEDSDADRNPQVPALTSPPEGYGRRDVIDDANTQPASLGLQSTMPGCVESHRIGSTPASSGMVRTVRDGTSARDSVPLVQSSNRFAQLTSTDEQAPKKAIGIVRESVEATRQSVVPTTVLATPPAAARDDGARIPEQPRRRRRLVLVSEHERGESDTDSIGDGAISSGDDGMSDIVPQVEPTAVEVPVEFDPRPSQCNAAFRILEGVSLVEIFHRRACVMRSVPFVVRGAYRMAMRIALHQVVTGRDQNSEVRVSRGWKLSTLLPRLLLHRPPRGGLVPKRQLEERFRLFQQGDWRELVARSSSIDAQAHQLSSRRRRRHRQDDEERRW